MTIIFYILCIAVGVSIAYILGLQFYKLGLSLKNRFPILYRLYLIAWILAGSLALIGVLVATGAVIKDYQREQKTKKIALIFQKYSNGIQYADRIENAKENNYSDKEIYQQLKQSQKLKKAFDELQKEGITEDEIGEFLDLYPNNTYLSEARIAANEASKSADGH